MPNSLILYAPNVHTGGGLVLLEELLNHWPKDKALRAILDQRARYKINLPVNSNVVWVDPTVRSRLRAERRLASSARSNDIVFCFHGLPPLFKSAGHVVLFHQNRLLLDLMKLRDFPFRTGLRVAVERWISRLLRHNVDEYVVQTPTMARALSRWHGKQVQISIVPFSRQTVVQTKRRCELDFVYVSDGLPHKNHARLLAAWLLLAEEGFYPTLVLTLGERDNVLAEQVNSLSQQHGLNIRNLGQIDHNEVISLYSRARALIFPSLGESFGLPLIEARQLALPVIASELDYVRDVCEPVETFDPYSSVSIARAVKRFLGSGETPPLPRSGSALWSFFDF